MGTVVYEDDKIFGNSVNIASRVESMGVPGSVLISKKIRDEIKNQPEIVTQSLGKFEFKNVEDGMEVFAISNEGLTVPEKNELQGKFKHKENRKHPLLIPGAIGVLVIIAIIAYFKLGNDYQTLNEIVDIEEVLPREIRDKKVAVMVFKNQTMDESLNPFGMMASDWITQGLIEHTEAKVISAANENSNVQFASMGPIEFAQSTKADYVINGRYYLQETKFLVHANLVDGKNGEVVFTLNPTLEGSSDDPMPLLKELLQRLLGYWVLKDAKWAGKNPPKFQAYQEFLKSIETWQKDKDVTDRHLRKAFEIDTTYYSAVLKRAVNFFNWGDKEKGDSCIQFLNLKKDYLSDYEKKRLEAVSLRVNNGRKERIKQAEIYEKMQEEYGRFGNNAVQDYSFTNHPQKAIEVYEKWYDVKDIGDDSNYQRYFAHYLDSKLALGLKDEVVKIMEELESEVLFSGVAFCHLVALIRVEDMEKLDHYLTKYSGKKLQDIVGSYLHPTRLLSIVCQELYLRDKMDLLDQYAKRPFEFYEINQGLGFNLKDYLAMLFFNERSDEIFEIIQKNPNGLMKAMEVYFLAKKGEDVEVDNSVSNDYGIAIMELAKGNKQKATEALIQSHEKGAPFFIKLFQNDFMLKELKGYPPFEEFVKPKEID